MPRYDTIRKNKNTIIIVHKQDFEKTFWYDDQLKLYDCILQLTHNYMIAKKVIDWAWTAYDGQRIDFGLLRLCAVEAGGRM